MKNILLTGPPRCGKSTIIEKIVQKGDRFIQQIKSRPDVLSISVTLHNRDELVTLYLTKKMGRET